MIHRIARAYGKFPHEVEDLTPYQLAMAQVCMDQAAREEATMIRDTQAKPAFIVGGLHGR